MAAQRNIKKKKKTGKLHVIGRENVMLYKSKIIIPLLNYTEYNIKKLNGADRNNFYFFLLNNPIPTKGVNNTLYYIDITTVGKSHDDIYFFFRNTEYEPCDIDSTCKYNTNGYP